MPTLTYSHPKIYDHSGRRLEGLTIVDGRIAATRTEQGTATCSLPGAVVVPGFIDTHAHLQSFGGGLNDLDLRDVDSAEGMLATVRAARAGLGEGDWIAGTGFVDAGWELPTPIELDVASGGRPVVLFRRDRHALLASSSALLAAAIDEATACPEGGSIEVRDGKLTGVLLDAAMDQLTDAMPKMSQADMATEAREKAQYLASLGVTCVHEAFVEPQLWSALCELSSAEALALRVRAMLGWEFSDAPTSSPDADQLRPFAVKGFADGALGSRGAQLAAPYADATDTCGLALQSDEELWERALLADRLGLQMAIHAIGDLGFDRVITLYERFAKYAGTTLSALVANRRWRVEHAQLVSRSALGRVKGLCAAVQPVHFWADAPWAQVRLGTDRLPNSHRIRSLLEHGARLGFGSDYPIESGDPLAGLAASTAWVHPGAPGWERQAESLLRGQALRCYWDAAAYLAFDENELGQLAPKYWADFVCLSADPFDPAVAVEDIHVVATYVGGRQVFVDC